MNEEEKPILVRVPFGFGQITFLGVDINTRAFQRWTPFPLFCKKLLNLKSKSKSDATSVRARRATGSGITDLKTQLSASNSQFPNVNRSSLWAVLGWLALYLLIVGPLDYFIVRKVFKRPQMTWVTLPIWVILAGGLASMHSSLDNGLLGKENHSEWQHNQIDIIDYDLASNTKRNHSLVTLYTADTRLYEINFPNDLKESTSDLIWSGNPEDGFGGMYREGRTTFEASRYQIQNQSSLSKSLISKMAMRTWSTREIWASQYQFSSTGQSPITSSLKSNAIGNLFGTLKSNFPVPIENWMIAYQNQIYSPTSEASRSIPPDVNWSLSNISYIKKTPIKSFLNGESTEIQKDQSGKYDQIHTSQKEYSLTELNPLRILHMLTFYQTLDGMDYTALKNRPLRGLDCSALLGSGRAILLGEVKLPSPAQLTINGVKSVPSQHRYFIRIVIPIQQISKD